MSFASDLLLGLDQIRAIPDEMGLRLFSVIVRVVTWTGTGLSGSRTGVGLGSSSFTDTPFLTGSGHRPKVRQVSAKDIVASGGLYHAQDLKVGPLTPVYPSNESQQGGGVPYSTIDPPVTGLATETYYGVTGGSLPGRVFYDKQFDITDHAMSSYMILRRSANQNPGGSP